jgi:hypothetical protein
MTQKNKFQKNYKLQGSQINKYQIITHQVNKHRWAIGHKQVTKIKCSSYSINQKKEVVVYAERIKWW